MCIIALCCRYLDIPKKCGLHDHLPRFRKWRSFSIWPDPGPGLASNGNECGSKRMPGSNPIHDWHLKPIVQELVAQETDQVDINEQGPCGPVNHQTLYYGGGLSQF